MIKTQDRSVVCKQIVIKEFYAVIIDKYQDEWSLDEEELVHMRTLLRIYLRYLQDDTSKKNADKLYLMAKRCNMLREVAVELFR